MWWWQTFLQILTTNIKLLEWSNLAFGMSQQSATVAQMSVQIFYWYSFISGQEIDAIRSAISIVSLQEKQWKCSTNLNMQCGVSKLAVLSNCNMWLRKSFKFFWNSHCCSSSWLIWKPLGYHQAQGTTRKSELLKMDEAIQIPADMWCHFQHVGFSWREEQQWWVDDQLLHWQLQPKLEEAN